MLLLVADESLVDASCQCVRTAFGQEVALFVGSGDVSQFHEYPRHGGFSQHEESGLVYPFVNALGRILELALDEGGEVHALFHVLVLQELEDDVAFRRVRVETCISLLVVTLDEDNGVFLLRHFQVVVRTVEPQCVGFRSSDGTSFGYRVGMDRDEEVGLGVVGYLSATV